MISENRSYYVAAGRSLDAVNAVIAQRRKANEARVAFAKRFGASDDGILVHYGHGCTSHVVGFKFTGKPPVRWLPVKVRGASYPEHYAPAKRSKADKELWREIDRDLAWEGWDKVGNTTLAGDMRMYWPLVEEIGDKWIISVHSSVEAPVDAIPLKLSEYCALRESVAVSQPKDEAAA